MGLAGEQTTKRIARAAERRLAANYKASFKAVQGEIAEFYRKYAGGDGAITREKALQYSRLKNLEKRIAAELRKMPGQEVNVLKSKLKDVYSESFRREAFALEKLIERDFGVGLQFGTLPEQQVLQAVMNPIDNVTTWNERVAMNNLQMRRRVNDAITRGIIQGRGYVDVGRELKDLFDKGAWQAIRVARTEGHRAREAGTAQVYGDAAGMGVVLKKQWLAASDERVRDSHADADGQEVEPDEPFVVNGEELMYPGDPAGSAENVINCRCTQVPVVIGVDLKKGRGAA